MSIDTSINTGGLDRSANQNQTADIGLRNQRQAGQIEARAVESVQQAAEQRRMDPEREAQAVQEAADQIGEFLNVINSDLNISVDRDVNRTVVKVINRSSDEVIRQIPSEEVLSLMRRMSEIANQTSTGNASGMLLSDQA
ncbi:flagellar protein FlaG [Nitrincola sp.]|uniref:flagellar protein FlaG n=1 Tax=Nitrincola sp. TaxID=1926584 RepID=UPI003A8F30DA